MVTKWPHLCPRPVLEVIPPIARTGHFQVSPKCTNFGSPCAHGYNLLQQRFAPRLFFLDALESRRHERNLSKSCTVCLELALEHSVWMPCSIACAQGVDEGSHVTQFLAHVVPQLFFSGRRPHDLYVNGLARSLPVAPQRRTFHIFGFWASQNP